MIDNTDRIYQVGCKPMRVQDDCPYVKEEIEDFYDSINEQYNERGQKNGRTE